MVHRVPRTRNVFAPSLSLVTIASYAPRCRRSEFEQKVIEIEVDRMRTQAGTLFLCALFPVACVGLEQYVAFDAASASGTYSTGNLVGSPAFTAQQALSGGSGYWFACA
jgi:hypothetical protein